MSEPYDYHPRDGFIDTYGSAGDVCLDPDTCTKDHNEETSTGEIHHYGCECGECMYQYWLLKR